MEIAEWFRVAFAISPEFIYTAPGGMNLLGHYAPLMGFALPITLSQQVLCAVGPREDRRVVVRSMQSPAEIVDLELDSLQPADDLFGPFSSRIGAAAFGQGPNLGHLQGLNVVVGSDDVRIIDDLSMVPATALNAVVALALYDQAHPFEFRLRLAHEIQRGEQELLHWNTGLVEHVATMFGKPETALLYDWERDSLEFVPLNLRAAGLSLLVADIRGTDGEKFVGRDGEREHVWESAKNVLLELQSMRPTFDSAGQFDEWFWSELPDRLQDVGDPTALGLVTHVLTENDRVRDAATRLRGGEDPRLLGPALSASHASLETNYQMRMSQGVQAAVQAAISAGALGARLTGGPFSDWVVALVESPSAPTVRSAVETAMDEMGLLVHIFEAVPTAAAASRRVV